MTPNLQPGIIVSVKTTDIIGVVIKATDSFVVVHFDPIHEGIYRPRDLIIINTHQNP